MQTYIFFFEEYTVILTVIVYCKRTKISLWAFLGCTMMLGEGGCYLHWVLAFPGVHHAHADPSCLFHPCLQQHPSHHEHQQGPIKSTDHERRSPK